jgi:transposase-like protein
MLVDTIKIVFANIFSYTEKKEMIIMGRTKGGKNRYWSKEEKLRIINRNLIDNESVNFVAKDEGISSGLMCNWIKKYSEQGEDALKNKRKPGNPFAKYQSSKTLSEVDQLKYENMKLRLENSLLKKGLTLEEVVKNRKKL